MSTNLSGEPIGKEALSEKQTGKRGRDNSYARSRTVDLGKEDMS